MAHRKLPYDPLGIAVKTGNVYKNVHNVFQGDLLEIDTVAFLRDGTTPATPENSIITFTIVDDRFRITHLSTGVWGDGAEQLNDIGGVRLTVPETLTGTMRRGGFMYTVTITDILGTGRQTIEEGTIQVEYGADAPLPDVPYRTDDGIQNDPSGSID